MTAVRFACVLRDVPITGTSLSHLKALHEEGKLFGRKLGLRRVPGNKIDPWTTEVLDGYNNFGAHLGHIGRRTGHSKQVGERLDACKHPQAGYIQVTECRPDVSTPTRLYGDVYLPVEESKPSEPYRVSCSKASNRTGSLDLTDLRGNVLQLRTTITRSSVDVLDPQGERLAWFSKSDLPEGLNFISMVALPVGRTSVDLVSRTEILGPTGPEIPQGSIDVLRRTVGGVPEREGLELSSAANYRYATESRFPPSPQQAAQQAAQQAQQSAILSAISAVKFSSEKETTMTFAQNVTQIINANKSAAATAGYMEAGRIANNQAAKLASKHLPIILRGYADTAAGKLVIANIAAVAVKQLRPNDATLTELTEAMTVQAFQEIYQSVDIEGIIDSLLSSPEMAKAVGKLKAGKE